MTEQYNLKLNKTTDSVEVVVSVVPQTNVEGYTRLCVLNSDKQRQLINNLFVENNINKNNSLNFNSFNRNVFLKYKKKGNK